LQVDIQTPSASDPHCECVGQEKGKEEVPAPGDRPPHSLSSSCSTPTDEKEEMISERQPTFGLRRVLAGFNAMVHHSGPEWRTENKRSSVNDDVVGWSGQIPLPSDSSTIVLIYASFQFQSMTGTGERLRQLTITVEQLLDCSAVDVPFTFFTNDGHVFINFCNCQTAQVRGSPSARRLGPHCSITEPQGELEDATNQGHHTLSRYRKYGGKRDLERSITAFERALSLCLLKVVVLRAGMTPSRTSLKLELYRNALAARPSTLIQLDVVHFARFKKRRDEVEVA
ncbi:hypothetical protein EV363DRAFT_1154551, partial [Boletus edulis]